MARVAIIMGSVFGAAQNLANLAQEALHGRGHTTVYNPSALVSDIHDVDACLVITSTTGQGDLPQNIEGFYFSARDTMPLQKQKPFGVIALGDSSYQTFCGAGEKMEELFYELQGQAPVPMLRIDACETLEPETKALPWLDNWMAHLPG
jgi:MioC protein